MKLSTRFDASPNRWVQAVNETVSNNNDTEYLNRKSVASLIDCSVRLVDYMVARGDLPAPL